MKKYLLILLMSIFFLSCEKEEPPVTPHTPTVERTIKVFVNHVYTLTPEPADSAVAGAMVKLFHTEIDRDQNINEAAVRYTNASGEAIFEYRSEEYYYILVDHPDLGTQLEETSAPAGTVSMVYIKYY